MNRRAVLLVIVGSLLLTVSIFAAFDIGLANISPRTVLEVFWCKISGSQGSFNSREEVIVWDVRGARIVLAAIVGAGLSICGAIMQSLVRNVLADPYLLGTASGASAGAATILVFGISGVFGLAGAAFIGAVVATVATFAIASTGGTLTSSRVILAGITIGFAMTALTNLMVFASGDEGAARSVMFWMLGSLALASWDQMLLPILALLVTMIVGMGIGSGLDAMSVSDETAQISGFNPQRLRLASMLLVSACIAVLVSAAGQIGFVGLVIPHAARRLVGATNRSVIPVSALLGATLMVWADVIGRIAFQPREIPLGIITALVGTPVLIALVRRQYSQGSGPQIKRKLGKEGNESKNSQTAGCNSDH